MKIGRIATLALILLSICLVQRAGGAGNATISKVVIDPGHGGEPGAMYGKIAEKDITLAIALKLGALIKENYPEVKVIYTRKKDVAVDLKERGNIANKAGADLFISIHTNSSKVGAPSGSETFVMGLDKSGKSLDVAMRENDVIVYEDDYSSKYQGYEPGSPESFIMFNLMQYNYLEQSLSLASLIEQQYRKMQMLPSRGVKQAPFWVLWSPAMPSLLTEVGFLNNPSDLKIITSSAGQENIARAIFNAFSAYKTRVDGNGMLIALGATGSDSSRTDAEAVPADPASAKTAPDTAPAPDNGGAITFAVQVCASAKKMSTHNGLLKPFASEVYEYKENTYYHYYVGRYASYSEAARRQAEMRGKVKDAFVVALRGGRKMPVAEARRMTEK